MSQTKNATFEEVVMSIKAVAKNDLKSVVIDAAIEEETIKLKAEGIKITNLAINNISELGSNLKKLEKQTVSQFRPNGENIYTEDKVYPPEVMKKINTTTEKLNKTKKAFNSTFSATVTITSLRELEKVLNSNKPEQNSKKD